MQTATTAMYQFRITYLNEQGALMRVLGIVTRRGLDLPYVHAEQRGEVHQVTLQIAVNPKQLGQLGREWSVAPDIIEIQEPIRVVETRNVFHRMRHAAFARMGRLARPESLRQPWRSALARLFALVPSP